MSARSSKQSVSVMTSDPAMLGTSGYVRREHDPYLTRDIRVVRTVLWVMEHAGWPVPGLIHEPCCGEGHLAEQLKAFGRQVHSTDLVDRGYDGLDQMIDAMLLLDMVGDAIFTNPPFKADVIMKLMKRFILIAKKRKGMVFLIMRHAFDAAGCKKRRGFFQSKNYFGKIVLPFRIIFEPPMPGCLKTTPRHDYDVYVWNFHPDFKGPGRSYYPTRVPGMPGTAVCQGDVFTGICLGLDKVRATRRRQLSKTASRQLDALEGGSLVALGRGGLPSVDGEPMAFDLAVALSDPSWGIGVLEPIEDGRRVAYRYLRAPRPVREGFAGLLDRTVARYGHDFKKKTAPTGQAQQSTSDPSSAPTGAFGEIADAA